MDVTIEYKEEPSEPFRIEEHQTWWGGRKTRQIAQEPVTLYKVYLYLVPSEEERAVILKYKVSELMFDDEPEYSPRQIKEAAQKLMEAAERHDQRMLAVASQKEMTTLQEEVAYWERELEHRKYSKIGTRLEEYFDNPFVRAFEHPQDAQAYIDRLQETTLPRIKAYIQDYASRPDRLSFSL